MRRWSAVSLIITGNQRSCTFVAFRACRSAVGVCDCFELRYGNKAEPIGSSLYPLALSEMGLSQIGCLFSAFESFVDPLAVREFGEGWKVCSDKVEPASHHEQDLQYARQSQLSIDDIL
ncbi:hypothetical protein [Rhizobium ruizarguesonis]|uniref:hypothetical protein n=1 Tax=Rhizobium ruizarguesonis TaxID=2081791 RepID=UPI0013EEA084|nr:hypothetical protein [Rhizobium ruizarguesonis]